MNGFPINYQSNTLIVKKRLNFFKNIFIFSKLHEKVLNLREKVPHFLLAILQIFWVKMLIELTLNLSSIVISIFYVSIVRKRFLKSNCEILNERREF